jgi:hypothetical protein
MVDVDVVVIGDRDGEVIGHDGGGIGHVAVAVADHAPDYDHLHVYVRSVSRIPLK